MWCTLMMTLINSNPSLTNLALDAISSQGRYNCFKFKPSKCIVIGADPNDSTEYRLGNSLIIRAEQGLLLGVEIKKDEINALEHVRRRKGMVSNTISQIKAWRNHGLSAKAVFRNLFKGKILPRFTYAFSLLHLPEWGPVQDLIREVFDEALSRTCALKVKVRGQPGLWTAIMGFPPVESFLCQQKLLLAARLLVGKHKACRMFRGLLKDDPGSFERDVVELISDWSLGSTWRNLSVDSFTQFKKKVKRVAKRQWPQGLTNNGQLKWLYHNYRVYSGNVPEWADWKWPQKKVLQKFELHFGYLLTGVHPAGGEKAVCSHSQCGNGSCDSVYNHHFFKCPSHIENRIFFKETARRLFIEKEPYIESRLSFSMLDAVLVEPCPLWVGLMDRSLFKPGVKLGVLHELHRIMTMASIYSWGRYYKLPEV